MPECSIKGKIEIKNSIIGKNSKIIREKNEESKKFLLGEGTQISV